MRIRIIGSEEDCERILSLLKDQAKRWGKRKLIKSRKFIKTPDHKPFYHIFAKDPCCIYVDMTLAEEEKKTYPVTPEGLEEASRDLDERGDLKRLPQWDRRRRKDHISDKG